jgi:hypothetical protein
MAGQGQGQGPALVDVHRLTGRCLSNADPEWSILRRGTSSRLVLGHCCCPFSDVGQPQASMATLSSSAKVVTPSSPARSWPAAIR